MVNERDLSSSTRGYNKKDHDVLTKFETKIKQYYDHTMFQQPWMGEIGKAMKQRSPYVKEKASFDGLDLNNDLIVRSPYASPEIIEYGQNGGYLIGQQIGYNKSNSALVFSYYYLDDDLNFICPPLIKEGYSIIPSSIPSLSGKMIEAGIDKKSRLTKNDIKDEIMKKFPSKYIYDWMIQDDISSFKSSGREVWVVRREQEDGHSFGFDTLYVCRIGYDQQLYCDEIFQTKGDRVRINEVKDDGDYFIIQSTKGPITINKNSLEKFEFPGQAKIKKDTMTVLSSTNNPEFESGKGTFSYDIKKAQKADVILLYRDNDMYLKMLDELEILNAEKEQPLNIYAIAVGKDIESIRNIKDIQEFISKYNPITDSTIANWAGMETQKIESGNEINDVFFNDLQLLNELCKENGIKKIYLLTESEGSNHNYLLEHGGYVKDDKGEFMYVTEQDAKMNKYRGDPNAVWEHYLTNVEIETIGCGRRQNNDPNTSYIKRSNDTQEINDKTILIADRHRQEVAKPFEAMGGRVQLIAGNHFEGNFSKLFRKPNHFSNQSQFAKIMSKNILKMHNERSQSTAPGYKKLFEKYGNDLNHKDFFNNIIIHKNGDIQLSGKLFCKNELGNYFLSAKPDGINIVDGSFKDVTGNKGPSKKIQYINSELAGSIANSQGKKLIPFDQVKDFINAFPGEDFSEKLKSLCILFDIVPSGYLDLDSYRDSVKHSYLTRPIRRENGESLYLGISDSDSYKDFRWLSTSGNTYNMEASGNRITPFIAYKDLSDIDSIKK